MSVSIVILLIIIGFLVGALLIQIEQERKESAKRQAEFLDILDSQDRAYNKQTNAMSSRHQQRIAELLDRIGMLEEVLSKEKVLLEDCHKYRQENKA